MARPHPLPAGMGAVRDTHLTRGQALSCEPQVDRSCEYFVGSHPDTESAERPTGFGLGVLGVLSTEVGDSDHGWVILNE